MGCFEGIAEVTQDRRARRRHSLAGNSVVDGREAFHQEGSRRCRHGEQTMRGPHTSGAERQRPDSPFGDAKPRDEPGRSDDIRDRIPCADFMELDMLRISAMHSRFGLGQMREDADCVP